MGHEDIRTTFDTNGHLFPDREEDLVAALDRRRAAAKSDDELRPQKGELIDFKRSGPHLR
jgi:hypothetical protein